jgi:hypothetical protein
LETDRDRNSCVRIEDVIHFSEDLALWSLPVFLSTFSCGVILPNRLVCVFACRHIAFLLCLHILTFYLVGLAKSLQNEEQGSVWISFCLRDLSLLLSPTVGLLFLTANLGLIIIWCQLLAEEPKKIRRGGTCETMRVFSYSFI